jgi:hypothetical protein
VIYGKSMRKWARHESRRSIKKIEKKRTGVRTVYVCICALGERRSVYGLTVDEKSNEVVKKGLPEIVFTEKSELDDEGSKIIILNRENWSADNKAKTGNERSGKATEKEETVGVGRKHQNKNNILLSLEESDVVQHRLERSEL